MRIKLFTILLVPVLACGAACEKKDDSYVRAKAFETNRYPAEDSSLIIRLEDETSGVILLGTETYGQEGEPAGAVGRFDPRTGSLTMVGRQVWDAGDGEVCECMMQMYHPTIPIAPTSSPGAEREGAIPIKTVGQTVLKLVGSPNEEFVAVLSAKGKKGIAIIPFTSGRPASGPYYHQVFRRADGKALGPPVILEGGRTHLFDICWSPDSQHVVYSSQDFAHLWVVSVNQKDGN